jgi:nucleotide-binding universal stress UspA family protein
MIKKILIATDGSDTSKKAVLVGIDMARRAGGSIIAIYVVDVSRISHLPGYAMIPGIKEKIIGLMEEEGRQATGFAEDGAQEANVPCHKIISQGNPSQELLRLSRDLEADLLILGSRGRSGAQRYILGSVAEKVVQQSTVPVLLIKGD